MKHRPSPIKTLRSTLILFVIALGAISCVETQPAANAKETVSSKTLINTDANGLALEGYDPVAYFTEKKPVKGQAGFTAFHEGATYHFASAAHRDLFLKKPDRYAPAFGGYCGYAASIGKVRPVIPTLWSVVDGRLILQHSKGAVELWEKDIPGNKARAERYWPRLVEVKTGKKNPVDGLLGPSVLPEAR